MKKERSVTNIVTSHILHTAIVFPFFGLLAGYFLLKFLGKSLDSITLMILKDLVNITFFFLGVKYSLAYIEKKIIVTNPESSSIVSIVVFGILVTGILVFNILHSLNLIGIVYNTIFFGSIFVIFFLFTNKYFIGLQTSRMVKA